MRTRLIRACLALSMLASAAAPSWGQSYTTVYPAKFICGYFAGNVNTWGGLVAFPPGGSLQRLVEPGDYNTVINLFHNQVQADSLQVWAFMEEKPAVFVQAYNNVGPFEVIDIGCRNLVSAMGGSTAGFVFEGWLLIYATSPTFTTQAAYTYAAQNGFTDNQQWQVNAAGTLLVPLLLGLSPANPFGVYVPAGGGTPPTPLPAPGIPGQVATSGGGGLGVGVSLDIEDVEPVTLAAPLTQDKIVQLMQDANPFPANR